VASHVSDRGGAGGEVQFREDVRDVPVHGVLAQGESRGDLPVAQTLRDQTQDFQLSLCQARKSVRLAGAFTLGCLQPL
jgi:hypothetical protein